MKNLARCLPPVFGILCCMVTVPVRAQWTAGMDDDAGKAAATSTTDLPAADFTGMRHIYPKRDRLFTTSLDGTWAFKFVKGLDLIYTHHYGFYLCVMSV